MTSNPITLHVASGQEMTDYEIASAALARAVSVDDVKRVHDAGERLKFEARKAGDTELLDNAVKLVLRAQRRLGEMLIDGREAGLISDGRPKKGEEGRIRLADLKIDRKLSMKAQKLARFDLRDFDAMLDAGSQKIRAGKAVVINPVKDLGKKEKALRRAIKLAQLADKQKALPAGKFGVILADPEWPDEDVWSDAGLDRAPDNYYPTSSVAAICARPVGDIAADDCVLGLWITMAHLARGTHVKVLEAWGFSPRTILIWDKVNVGMGRWVRNRLEALVIAVRGKMPCPLPGTQWEDLVVEASTIHSRKPDFAHEWFEQFFPTLTKIELNARRARPGWSVWGLEAPEPEPEAQAWGNVPGGDIPAHQGHESYARMAEAPDEDSSEEFQDSIPPRSGQEADRFGGPDQPKESADPAGSLRLPGDRQVPFSEYPEASGTAREAPGRSAPGNGIAGLSEDRGISSEGEPAAQSAADQVEQEGTQSAPSPLAVAAEDLKGEPHAGEAPALSASPASLTTDQQNGIIKAAYLTVPFPGLEAIARETGLNPNTIKQRAKRRGWGDEAHRLAIVSQPGRASERQAAR